MLVAAVMLTAAYFTGNAQTEGTNTLGVGFNAVSYKHESVNSVTENKSNSFNLGVGRFIKDNLRLGFSGSYNHSTFTGSGSAPFEMNGYGGAISVQKYFPLLKKFYAFAGGNSHYMYSKRKNDALNGTEYHENYYFLGANGGASYFLSKHFALEVDVLSGGLSYTRGKESGQSGTTTSTNFDVSSSGSLTNLGFRVYFLF